ncbi:uncharacterized protein BJ212DRAFT_1443514 [Suillus subaureus]|uniref:N-acetyltransferase domain-containing protein n=1 Tax=Suillus subaureus TaxID=48587 RepID=A0A9P7EQK3_9AGAM|nr:uncharacterized protein BJ212DRAFT_1443514 [Suillus subaureus]KAG1827521.1 hypothetical protein BJ212DRAFT_1443514 [Suillus subaureus]
MSVLRPFKANDLFRFNNINLDYGITFYLTYLQRWSDLCFTQESPRGRLQGYILGKAEGAQTEWHEYRRLSLARNMCQRLEFASDEIYKGYFVDLYVRCNNALAIKMYEGMGYSVYRRVREYYGNLGVGKGGRDEEDAFDMRKCLSRDMAQRSIRSNGRDMIVSAHDVS